MEKMEKMKKSPVIFKSLMVIFTSFFLLNLFVYHLLGTFLALSLCGGFDGGWARRRMKKSFKSYRGPSATRSRLAGVVVGFPMVFLCFF